MLPTLCRNLHRAAHIRHSPYGSLPNLQNREWLRSFYPLDRVGTTWKWSEHGRANPILFSPSSGRRCGG